MDKLFLDPFMKNQNWAYLWINSLNFNIFSTHFAIRLFYLHNMKIVHGNKNKTKSRHMQIDLALYCSIQLTNSAMLSLKDGVTVWSQSQKKDFLSIIY